MRVEEALSQVRAMQSQVARAQQYCCYRSATVGASGLSALGAAMVQSYWIPRPVDDLRGYLCLWVSVAVLSVVITGAEILVRWLRTDSPHARYQTIAAVRQFTPCLVAGALLTWAITAFSSEHATLLPALWAMFFSLGIFASSRYLPSGSLAMAVYYLVAGLVCLRWGQGEEALAPWTMMITFGAGQMLAAIVLYRRQEIADDIT